MRLGQSAHLDYQLRFGLTKTQIRALESIRVLEFKPNDCFEIMLVLMKQIAFCSKDFTFKSLELSPPREIEQRPA